MLLQLLDNEQLSLETRAKAVLGYMKSHAIDHFVVKTSNQTIVRCVLHTFDYGCFKGRCNVDGILRNMANDWLYGLEDCNQHSWRLFIDQLAPFAKKFFDAVGFNRIPLLKRKELTYRLLETGKFVDEACFGRFYNRAITDFLKVPFVHYINHFQFHPRSAWTTKVQQIALPIWSRNHHQYLDSEFKAVTKTLLLANKFDRPAFPMPKDVLINVLLPYLFNAHLRVLESRLADVNRRYQQLFVTKGPQTAIYLKDYQLADGTNIVFDACSAKAVMMLVQDQLGVGQVDKDYFLKYPNIKHYLEFAAGDQGDELETLMKADDHLPRRQLLEALNGHLAHSFRARDQFIKHPDDYNIVIVVNSYIRRLRELQK